MNQELFISSPELISSIHFSERHSQTCKGSPFTSRDFSNSHRHSHARALTSPGLSFPDAEVFPSLLENQSQWKCSSTKSPRSPSSPKPTLDPLLPNASPPNAYAKVTQTPATHPRKPNKSREDAKSPRARHISRRRCLSSAFPSNTPSLAVTNEKCNSNGSSSNGSNTRHCATRAMHHSSVRATNAPAVLVDLHVESGVVRYFEGTFGFLIRGKRVLDGAGRANSSHANGHSSCLVNARGRESAGDKKCAMGESAAMAVMQSAKDDEVTTKENITASAKEFPIDAGGDTLLSPQNDTQDDEELSRMYAFSDPSTSLRVWVDCKPSCRGQALFFGLDDQDDANVHLQRNDLVTYGVLPPGSQLVRWRGRVYRPHSSKYKAVGITLISFQRKDSWLAHPIMNSIHHPMPHSPSSLLEAAGADFSCTPTALACTGVADNNANTPYHGGAPFPYQDPSGAYDNSYYPGMLPWNSRPVSNPWVNMPSSSLPTRAHLPAPPPPSSPPPPPPNTVHRHTQSLPSRQARYPSFFLFPNTNDSPANCSGPSVPDSANARRDTSNPVVLAPVENSNNSTRDHRGADSPTAGAAKHLSVQQKQQYIEEGSSLSFLTGSALVAHPSPPMKFSSNHASNRGGDAHNTGIQHPSHLRSKSFSHALSLHSPATFSRNHLTFFGQLMTDHNCPPTMNPTTISGFPAGNNHVTANRLSSDPLSVLHTLPPPSTYISPLPFVSNLFPRGPPPLPQPTSPAPLALSVPCTTPQEQDMLSPKDTCPETLVRMPRSIRLSVAALEMWDSTSAEGEQDLRGGRDLMEVKDPRSYRTLETAKSQETAEDSFVVKKMGSINVMAESNANRRDGSKSILNTLERENEEDGAQLERIAKRRRKRTSASILSFLSSLSNNCSWSQQSYHSTTATTSVESIVLHTH